MCQLYIVLTNPFYSDVCPDEELVGRRTTLARHGGDCFLCERNFEYEGPGVQDTLRAKLLTAASTRHSPLRKSPDFFLHFMPISLPFRLAILAPVIRPRDVCQRR
jgi:hypothetical protein